MATHLAHEPGLSSEAERERRIARGDAIWRASRQQAFDLDQHGDLLTAILDEIRAAPDLSQRELALIMRRHTLPNGDMLSKDLIIRGYRELCRLEDRDPDPAIFLRLRIKPTRTISGVAPVAVLTELHPCPGECIFCPEPEGMPPLTTFPLARPAPGESFAASEGTAPGTTLGISTGGPRPDSGFPW